MTELSNKDSLTLREPRITAQKFLQILTAHNSPARAEALDIWNLLTAGGVDPSFALGQFHVESLMGKSGYAVQTKSWGNMLWDAAWTADRPKYHPAGSDFTYAKFDSWTQGVKYYVQYVQRYAVTKDDKTGQISNTIDTETSRWTGKVALSAGHANYVQTILSLMNDEFDYVPGVFIETGDKMISINLSGVTTTKRYFIPNRTPLYRGTNGDVLKLAAFAGSGGNCRFLGPVNQAWSDATWEWGAVIVNVLNKGETIVYLKSPDKAKVTSA